MIIAAWVGTGKSYLKKYPNILDLESTPYRWIYQSIENYEKYKSSPNLSTKQQNPEFPKNYYDYLIKVKDQYDAVLIPVQSDIIKILVENKVDFISVFPSANLKSVYKKRLIKRGNTEEFIKHILTVWEEKQELLKQHKITVIAIKENEYLEDILSQLEIIKKI